MKFKNKLAYIIKRLGYLILNSLLFCFLLPLLFLLFILLLFNRFKEKKRYAFFVGLEHVIQKSITRAEFFQKKSYDVIFYSFETTNKSIPDVKDLIVKANYFVSVDIIKFGLTLISKNPIYVELYFEGVGINQVFYSTLSRLHGSLVISIFRGGELYYYQFNKRKLKTYLCIITAHISHRIFYRETYMTTYLKKFRIPDNKIYFDYNKIPVRSKNILARGDLKILFLNSIKKWRRVELLIEAFSLIRSNFSNVKLVIVGARNDLEYKQLHDFTVKYRISESTNIHYWTNDPYKYINDASIFVLPADLVFCNFSLLQSMEQGLVPIVAKVEDADRIIIHGVNGFLAEQNPRDIAKFLSILIEDEKLRLEMGKQARRTIIDKFNDKDRMIPVLNLLQKKFNYFNN